jgi:hypothetical protein
LSRFALIGVQYAVKPFVMAVGMPGVPLKVTTPA